jgi:hypothetical protein
VASIAVLGDGGINWRPNQFGYNLFGCSVDFQFPIVKLIDYRQRQEERRMRYVTSFERIGIEKGIEQGIEQSKNQLRQGLIKGISLGLKLKFGELGTSLLPEIESIASVDTLSAVLDAIAIVDTVEQLQQVYQPVSE